MAVVVAGEGEATGDVLDVIVDADSRVHGIGNLYIMARAATQAASLGNEHSWLDMLAGWQASIGKAVLESWGFAEQMCDAVGEQTDHELSVGQDAPRLK